MSIQQSVFGKLPDGRTANLFIFTNANGLIAKVTDFGGILTEMHVPDSEGNLADISLGFDNLDGYTKKHPYFGAIVGRVANRTANAKFTLNGKEYTLAANNGPHHLHGGIKGFDKVLWESTIEGDALKLTYLSVDGEEGYPGNLKATVIYKLTDENELIIEMLAEADAATPVNIVNHAYWNLAGQACGDILGHELTLNADNYTPVDDTLIPTGEIAAVAGTPLDFRLPVLIGERIDEVGGDPCGYDHNFVLNGELNRMKLVARVRDPKSGRTMEVLTTEPGVQFYSGNFLNGTVIGKGGVAYQQHTGFCLETQHYPDSANKPGFPSIVLQPGETYRHVMVHKFLS